MNQTSFHFIYFSIILVPLIGFGAYFIYKNKKLSKLPKEEYINLFEFLVKYHIVQEIDENEKLKSIPVENNYFLPARGIIEYAYHYGDIQAVGKVIHIIYSIQQGTIVPRKHYYEICGSINDYKITLYKKELEENKLFVNEALIEHYGLEKLINVK